MDTTSENPIISVWKALHEDLIPKLPSLTAGGSVGLGEQTLLKWWSRSGERNVSYIGEDSEMFFGLKPYKTGIHANHVLRLPILTACKPLSSLSFFRLFT